MITSLQLLDPDECALVCRGLEQLRDLWTPRSAEPAHFFTLGAPSYLDDATEYWPRAEACNPVLLERFDWLYGKLAAFLSWRLGASVEWALPMGVPGFHIWHAGGIFTQPLASIHFDLQYMRHWAAPELGEPDLARPISFTLALRLPRQGGGLNLWDVDYQRFMRFRDAVGDGLHASAIALLMPPLKHAYTLGGISLHSGHQLHQIAEVSQVDPDDQRITLQGHALFARGRWKLYW